MNKNREDFPNCGQAFTYTRDVSDDPLSVRPRVQLQQVGHVLTSFLFPHGHFLCESTSRTLSIFWLSRNQVPDHY